MPHPHANLFYVHCCGKRRNLFPGGILVCLHCDQPREHMANMGNLVGSHVVQTEQRRWDVRRG